MLQAKRKYLSGPNTIVYIEREVCVWVCHLQFKDHVEHALGTVGLQQLDNVRMLQHVTYCGFAFQI